MYLIGYVKQNLSKVLRQVRTRGKPALIYKRGEVVAELRPKFSARTRRVRLGTMSNAVQEIHKDWWKVDKAAKPRRKR